jgi:hypothetical protein
MIIRRTLQVVDRYCLPWAERRFLRQLFIVLLFATTLGFGCVASSPGEYLGFAVRTSIVAGVVLIFSLVFDSGAVFWYFYGFSKRSGLRLVCRLDCDFDAMVKRLKHIVQTVPENQLEKTIKREAKEVIDDFVTRRPLRPLIGLLLRRTALNLLLTIFVFSILGADITILHNHQNPTERPYGHDCRPNGTGYVPLLLHNFYYHTVIFQSLGDGSHAPATISTQVLATFESYLAMIYLVFLLGGSISVAIFVEGALTEDVIEKELLRSVFPIWSRRVPIKTSEDPRISIT